MKLYTIYSDSHKHLFENFFLKTLPDEFELITEQMPQECETGKFQSGGWSKTCKRKVEFFIQACKQNMGKVFVVSDVDIQFFGNIKATLLEELGDYDIAVQNDCGEVYCSGFWVCRGNERTLHMFESMLETYMTFDNDCQDDQTAMNANIHLCKSKFLSEKFFTVGHVTKRLWNGEEFNIPYDILVHHANWVLGIDKKIELLKNVKKIQLQKIVRAQNPNG